MASYTYIAARSRRTRRRAIMLLNVVVVLGSATSCGDDSDGGAVPSANGLDQTTTTSTENTTSPTDGAGSGESPNATDAAAVVDDFIRNLQQGQLDHAASLWSGYPSAMDDPGARIDQAEHFMEGFRWLIEAPYHGSLVVRPATTTSGYVVVVTAPRSDVDPRREAAAFLVDDAGSDADLRIQRLPSEAIEILPSTGAGLVAGDTVTVAQAPVEGEARAYLNESELPVDVDHESGSSSVMIPASATGEVVVTFSLATPEFPTAVAAVYAVSPG